MKQIWNSRWVEHLFLLLILVAAFFLFLCNLGNQYLWQDEAQTALVSKTILSHGIPLGYDGRNFFSQELKAEYGENYIWRWHTWLPFYVLAGFFGLFGVNTFVARLPFALFGIGTVFMTYLFCKAMWKSKRIAGTAAVLLVICVPFLLLSRQCRWYSLSAFFSLMCLHAYVGLLDKKKYAYVTFILALVLLFHTHYIYCGTLLATVVLHTLLFHRDRFWTLLLLAGAVLVVNVPWVVWLSGMKYAERYGSTMFRINKLVVFAGGYLYHLGRHIFSPYLLVIIPLTGIGNRIRTGSFFPRNVLFWQKLSLPLFFMFFNVVALVAVSPKPYLRYMAPLVPISIVLVAMLVVALSRVHFLAAAAIVAVLVITGSLRYFLYEITHDYDGPIEGIVKYLNEKGEKDDIVAISYGDMPLKFYTNMRIVGGLTGEDLSPAKQAKWVILRKYNICPKDAKVSKYLRENIPLENYIKIVIDYPDIAFENREEPGRHLFRTVVDADSVVIFQRIK